MVRFETVRDKNGQKQTTGDKIRFTRRNEQFIM
ncbi:hypothetical protein SAMN05421543_10120 [Alicyclobacillus macrosporangiidus]|uniref:Uncharacterized protein n=1 Tax=Alicyclobacillus macrosporangiidus TaxID=392015 RepID=A0A1I7F1Y0_9BACL|nr:hypothetical protein SAMN05421543_10120 [Alicyclobacillus macrosporangiidus]